MYKVKLGILVLGNVCFGLLAAAGVFTVFSTVGLIPRFADKTHSAKKVMTYENMVILGTITGAIVSLFPEYLDLQGLFVGRLGLSPEVWYVIASLLLTVCGLFSGMFVGCLALAIAEMLDSIPIFSRRIGFRHGLGLAVTSMTIGKLVGSLYYFIVELHRTVET